MLIISILALFIILLRAFEPLAMFILAIVAVKAYREWQSRFYGPKRSFKERLQKAYAAFSTSNGS
jgi:hypothetical protein